MQARRWISARDAGQNKGSANLVTRLVEAEMETRALKNFPASSKPLSIRASNPNAAVQPLRVRSLIRDDASSM